MTSVNDLKQRTLFSLSWPIFGELFLQILLGNVDTLMLSQYSDSAVASVSVSVDIFNMFIIMFAFVSAGTGILVSQYLGAKDQEKAQQVVAVSLLVNFIFGLLISIGFLFFTPALLKIMKVPEKLFPLGIVFLKITGGFSFLQAIIMTISAVLRSYGLMKDTLRIAILMNIINVIGNSLFLFGWFGFPILGVTGVAISTTLSRLIGTIILFYMLFKRIERRLSFSDFKPFPKDILKNLLFIGGPSAAEHLFYQISQILTMMFISSMGVAALTTRAYVKVLSSFIFIFSGSIAQGTQIMVGHMVGANEMEGAYKRCLRTMKTAFVITTVIAVIFALFSKQLVGIFTDDKQIINLAVKVMVVGILLEVGRTFNIVIINSLKAAGDVVFPMGMGVLSMFGVSVVLSYVFGVYLGFGLPGVWLAFAADEWFRGIIMLVRWKSKIWQQKRLVKIKTEVEPV